jgi:hypothetical protein
MHAQLKPGFNQLSHTLQTILQELQKLDEIVLNQPPETGKWSCAQIMLHINLSISGTIAYLEKKMQQPQLIETTGIGAHLRSMLLNVALRSKMKFKAPKGLDQFPETTLLKDIESITFKNLEQLETLLNNFPANMLSKNVFKHPVAGRISMQQTLQFLDAHAVRHHKQMEHIIKKKS